MALEIANIQEARSFLDAHPEIHNIEVVLTNMSGVPRGKNIRRSELLALYEHGRYLPGSLLVADITGKDVEETGLVWDDGDADRIARPQKGTLVAAPWRGADVAQVIVSMYELDGKPNDLDPRVILANVLQRFAAMGLTPVVACELEFYLMDLEKARNGMMVPYVSSSAIASTQIQVNGLREIQDVSPWLSDLYACCDSQGLPVETIIAEYAPGQYELTLHHQADALLACDHAVLYKRTVKGMSGRHGAEATFMAKPFEESAGSGFHIHVSLQDGEGNNIFASDTTDGTAVMRHAIGGMKALLGDSMAIFAPNANSYRRFKPNSYAPVAPTWGVNNRTVSFRVPAGPPSSRHIEHRAAGADANPYLAMAAVLSAAHHGMVGQIDPGNAITGNGYAAPPEPGQNLPSTWHAATDRFYGSPRLREYLGGRFVEQFATVKRAEQGRFFAEVTAQDIAWYFRTA
jgi:glutamine synthetase